jgi:phosphatidylinositol alpha-mannosyltransferase
MSAGPLRVGMVCPYSLSIPGGVQAQVLGLARELRQRGYEVRVLGPCDGPPPESFVTPLGDSLPTGANGSVAPLAPDPAAALRTVRVLRDEQFDVIHVHEPLAPGVAITTTTMHLAPTVGTFHAAGRSSLYRMGWPILARLTQRLDHKVVVSKDALALVERYLVRGTEGSDFEVLFNGVETDRIRAAPRQATARPAIFFLGRHEERKGLRVLLEAMHHVTADVSVWVAGEGPDTDVLRTEFAGDPRIEWLGRIDEADKLVRLRSAAVFCAPSLHGESFGVVLIEAMAAGVPVVASALDGYRNVATDGVDAVLVEPGDPVALAGALSRLIADHELAGRLVAAGSLRADELAMGALAERYAAIYSKLSD